MKHQLQTIREALTAAANLIAHQYTGTSLGMTALQDASDDCLVALAALAQLEAMVGEQEPVAEWVKSPMGGFPQLVWEPGYVAAIGDKLYSGAAPVAQQPQAEGVPSDDLHTFLDVAAGEGLVLGGVDAADLYIELFPERYAAAIAAQGEKP